MDRASILPEPNGFGSNIHMRRSSTYVGCNRILHGFRQGSWEVLRLKYFFKISIEQLLVSVVSKM